MTCLSWTSILQVPMRSLCNAPLLPPRLLGEAFSWTGRGQISTSAVVWHVQAGKYKRTQYKTRPLTFEQSLIPATIGQHKTWNSFNTSNLQTVHSKDQSSQITIWEAFIRKFVTGTWHNLFVSEIIIKRRHNIIYITGIVQQTISARKMYFLIGYTEEFLGFLLKCPVKMEIQSVRDRKDVVHIYI